MAKRARGTTRPGQRPAVQRPPARPTNGTASRPIGASASAAVSADVAADAGILPASPVAGNGAVASRSRSRASGVFGASVAREYDYVGQDVRRIARVGGSIVAVMVVLYFLIDVFGVIKF